MCREYTNLRLVLIVQYQETQGDVQRVHQPQVSAYSAVSGDTGRFFFFFFEERLGLVGPREDSI